MVERRKFQRVRQNNWLGGVCGGIAYAFGFPVVLVRVGTLMFLFLSAYWGVPVLWIYILTWAFTPKWTSDPEDYSSRTL